MASGSSPGAVNSTVTLTYNAGAGDAAVPDVVGRQQTDAIRAIQICSRFPAVVTTPIATPSACVEIRSSSPSSPTASERSCR